MSSAVLVLDLGNSALKAVLFDGEGRVLHGERLPVEGDLPASLRERGFGAVVAVSVREDLFARLEERLAPHGVRLLGRDFPPGIENRTARPAETGLDRLCAAAAAHGRARGPAVALGAGTAVTADAVDGSGAFLGGAIAPGLAAAAAGLSRAAPRLPAPDLAPGAAALPGRDTAGALRAGHLLGFAGLLDRLAEEAARAAAPGGDAAAVPAFLHGGDAPLLQPFLRRPAVHAPWLVAEGAHLLWTRAGSPR